MKLSLHLIPCCVLCLGLGPADAQAADRIASASLPTSFALREYLEQRIVKLYGQGGFRGLEGYQTGLLVGPENYIATTNSLALSDGEVTVVFSDGRRSSARVIGADPQRDIALLQLIETAEVASFDLAAASPQAHSVGTAFVVSNLFNIAAGSEPLSIQQTHLAGEILLAPRERWASVIDGQTALLLDSVTSNPGAQGGAVVDRQGRLLGMIGRELRSRLTGAWQNYAIPVASLSGSIDRILSGSSDQTNRSDVSAPPVDTLTLWGFALVPSVVERTPPYVDLVHHRSEAEQSGLKPDDLVLMVDGYVTATTQQTLRQFSRLTQVGETPASVSTEVSVTIQRGSTIVEITLPLSSTASETN